MVIGMINYRPSIAEYRCECVEHRLFLNSITLHTLCEHGGVML